MKNQLWSQDEYGTSSIVGTFDATEAALKKASDLVTDANFGNSLTSTEQISSVEAYLVEFVDQKGKTDNSMVYASNRPDGKYRAMKLGANKLEVIEANSPNVRIYIGSKFVKQTDKTRTETRLYMKDQKGVLITNLAHPLLKGKTVYFVRQV